MAGIELLRRLRDTISAKLTAIGVAAADAVRLSRWADAMPRLGLLISHKLSERSLPADYADYFSGWVEADNEANSVPCWTSKSLQNKRVLCAKLKPVQGNLDYAFASGSLIRIHPQQSFNSGNTMEGTFAYTANLKQRIYLDNKAAVSYKNCFVGSGVEEVEFCGGIDHAITASSFALGSQIKRILNCPKVDFSKGLWDKGDIEVHFAHAEWLESNQRNTATNVQEVMALLPHYKDNYLRILDCLKPYALADGEAVPWNRWLGWHWTGNPTNPTESQNWKRFTQEQKDYIEQAALAKGWKA